jgi:nitroreductase
LNQVQQALNARTTVHEYKPGSVPEGSIERALEAALAAPNHRMTEPWRFVSIGPQTRQQLSEVAVRLKVAKLGDSEELRQVVRAKFLNPAHLMVVSQVCEHDPVIAREDYAAIACAIQNFMLSLHSEGVGSKWSTSKVIQQPETYRLLEIDPQVGEIVAFIWVGAPAKVTTKRARSRQLAGLWRQLP